VELTDSDAITQSLAEPRAFATVFDHHAALLFRFLIRRAGRDMADELLGETFRIAFEKRAGFKPEYASARPWIFGIATNLLAKHHRTPARGDGSAAGGTSVRHAG